MNTKTKKNKSENKIFILLVLSFIVILLLIISITAGKKEITSDNLQKEKKIEIENPKNQKTKIYEEKKNNPPFITNLKFKFEKVEDKIFLATLIEAKDADGDPITYIYEWNKNGELIGKGEKITDFKKGDKISVSVTPFDEKDYGISRSIDIEIANQPPVVIEHNEVIVEKDLIKYQVKAYDPDGDSLIYSFLDSAKNAKINSSTGLIEFKPDSNKKEKFNVKVSDQQGGEVIYSFELSFVEEENPGI